MAKILLLGIWWQGAPASARERDAGAELRSVTTPEKVMATEPAAAPVRELVTAVQARQAELEERATVLDRREERLAMFEEDVTTKLAALEAIERRLAGHAKAAAESAAATTESLAKIYGAMEPGAAARILDKLDDSTVLTIFRGMKEKQIGVILPLMADERAIGITRSLADRTS